MSWYHLEFNAAQVARGSVNQLKEGFAAAFAAAGGPRAMALFQRVRGDGGVDLFFTPDCGAFAAQFLERNGALPCDGPSLVGLQLLVGHNEITYYLTT